MVDSTLLQAPSFMSALPVWVRNKLTDNAVVIKYHNGELIHSRGDAKPGISIVKSGAVHVGVYGLGGSFVLTTRLGVGQCFGELTLFTNLPRSHDASASGSTEVYQIPGGKFSQLYDKNPEILKSLLSTTLVRNNFLVEILDAIRRLPLLERTAKILLIMSTTSGERYVVGCKQSELAAMLGVTRVSLSRVLKQLEKIGIIEVGYGHIKIPSPYKLQNWVDKYCEATGLELKT